MDPSAQTGKLYVVATPIGNYGDLTLRGLAVLRGADGVICEERRAGSTLLAHFQIRKPLYELNEHSRPDEQRELVGRMQGGEQLALISDHGTPLIQDPGAELVAAALEAGIPIEPIPGASAILAALVASGIAAPRFRFIGQLPAKAEERKRALESLREVRETLILLDAPYRLARLLDSLQAALGDDRRAAVACNLTMPDETFVRGTLGKVKAHFAAHPFKGEFVVVLEGNLSAGSKAR